MSLELGEIYSQMMEALTDIDVKLDSLSGGKSAGKRKVTSELTAKYEANWKDAVSQVIDYIGKQPADVQAAVYSAFIGELRTNYEKPVASYIEGLVDSQPKQEALISEEEAAVLSQKRSELYQKIKAVVDIAASATDEIYEMPPMRRGSTGKRGPRNLSLFTFFLDDVEVDMTIGQIAKDNGYEKASDLTKVLRDAGFDTREGSEFGPIVLPNGKTLTGVRDDSEEEDDEVE